MSIDQEAEQAFVDSYADVDWWAEQWLRQAVRFAQRWQLHSDPYEAMDRLAAAHEWLRDEALMLEDLRQRREQLKNAEPAQRKEAPTESRTTLDLFDY